MRPANIVTSVADVLAGVAISGYLVNENLSPTYISSILLLSLSTIGLYGGGVVFNDVFDAELDKIERPERPIPSGIISKGEGSLLGIILFATGIIAAAMVSVLSGLIAVSIIIAALVYDKWSKHNGFAGPFNMGLCRGLNLLLGISIVITAISAWWFVAIIPIIYIAAITMISRGEVHGGSKSALYSAALFYCIVIAAILFLSTGRDMIWWAAIFLIPFVWMIFYTLIKAIRLPSPQNIGKAVRAGVIALIVMDASMAAAFGATVLAFLIILLLPVSLWLAKIFAVT
ncbi:polyprenyltransferase [Hanamia caeni]|jgi:4-hydroxybenzoate polyprenyltransferase|uniref:Polyprenyltransferase n=2 Tax=Hanamia caeni TaxID=2294116 RepID=A0A3M9NMW8_9BACT|nr:polyprenyltransferase [Hanamia caeni]